MKVPEIICIKRTILSDGWPDGFVKYTLKYSDNSYLSDYGMDVDGYKEEVIYQGPFPKLYRVLPFVESKYLK